MRKIQAQRRYLIPALLAAFLSILSAHAQKPDPKREVKDVIPAPQRTLSAGAYYALIIGIDSYQSPLPKLQTAVNDATALAKLLREQYGFANIKLLPNATRNQVLLALNDFKRNLPENSNFISDSCYSGDLGEDRGFEISPAERDIYLRRMLESPSRNLMSSGGDEPVSDAGTDGHSVFAYALIQSLRTIPEDGFTAHDLFYKYVQQWVAGKSNQVPHYGSIKHSGHVFGDFVFSRSGKPVAVAPAPAISSRNTDSSGTVGGSVTVQPTVSLEADRYTINQLVNAYADSYNRRDATALWKIWPEAPKSTKQKIQNSFNSALSILMKVTDRDIQLGGTRATVTGQFAQEYTPKNGSLQKPSGPITLELDKKNGTWVITSIK